MMAETSMNATSNDEAGYHTRTGGWKVRDSVSLADFLGN